jgi:hypothetical protein
MVIMKSPGDDETRVIAALVEDAHSLARKEQKGFP